MTERLYTFTKSHRVRSRIDFSAVFETGIKQSRGPLTAFAVPTLLKHPRIGLSVGKRVGNAPRRNRVGNGCPRELLPAGCSTSFPRAFDLVIVVRPHNPMALDDYQRLLRSFIAKLSEAK